MADERSCVPVESDEALMRRMEEEVEDDLEDGDSASYRLYASPAGKLLFVARKPDWSLYYYNEFPEPPANPRHFGMALLWPCS